MYFNENNNATFYNFLSLDSVSPNSEIYFHNFINSKNTPSNFSPGIKVTLFNDKIFNFESAYIMLKSSRYFINLEIFNTNKNTILLKTKIYNKSLLFPFDNFVEKEFYL